jgi:peroxin-11B
MVVPAQANALIYHPTITHYLKFLATTVGRDKLLRTIQYFSRFYAWYLFRTNALPSSILPFEALKKQLGLTRKLMRVGKNVEHLKAAALAADANGGDSVVRALSVGRQLGYAGYLTMDLLTVPDALGAWKTTRAKRWGREAYRCWAAGLACSVLTGLYGLYRLREREGRVSKEDGEGVVESKRLQRYVVLTDMCIPDILYGGTVAALDQVVLCG